MRKSKMYQKLIASVRPVEALGILNDMDEAGTPWDPEEPELPARLRTSDFSGEIIPSDRPWSDDAERRACHRAAADAYNREREAEAEAARSTAGALRERYQEASPVIAAAIREACEAFGEPSEPAPEWPEELPWSNASIGSGSWLPVAPPLRAEVDRRWRECARLEREAQEVRDFCAGYLGSVADSLQDTAEALLARKEKERAG